MRPLRIAFSLVSLAFGFACAPTTQSTPEPVFETPAPAPAPAPATSAPAPSKAGPAGAMCGGIAGFGCAQGLYCSFPSGAQCGAADQSGICHAVPDMCTQELSPVCGCNDKTYSNACSAARESVSVLHSGACTPAPTEAAPASPAPASPSPSPAATPVLAEGQLCGTRGVQGDCASGFYCAHGPDCGYTDRGGKCAKRTEMCTKIYAPVCGCDDKTYGSACVAAGAGVSVKSKGECPNTKRP